VLTIGVEPLPHFVAYTGVQERLVAATFTESDKALTAADFAATIDWGDGMAPTAGKVAPFFTVSDIAYLSKPNAEVTG
jgi:hypothetical protein